MGFPHHKTPPIVYFHLLGFLLLHYLRGAESSVYLRTVVHLSVSHCLSVATAVAVRMRPLNLTARSLLPYCSSPRQDRPWSVYINLFTCCQTFPTTHEEKYQIPSLKLPIYCSLLPITLKDNKIVMIIINS